MTIKIGEIAASAVGFNPFKWKWLGWHKLRAAQKDSKGNTTGGYQISTPLDAEKGSELSISVWFTDPVYDQQGLLIPPVASLISPTGKVEELIQRGTYNGNTTQYRQVVLIEAGVWAVQVEGLRLDAVRVLGEGVVCPICQTPVVTPCCPTCRSPLG